LPAAHVSPIDPGVFADDAPGTPYLTPQVLTNVDHTMRIMRDETFGPAVGIMKVKDDEEAIALMNDSQYGLTCSIWTNALAKLPSRSAQRWRPVRSS
jgi:acyl-CoA reductase-like NAD-dependent aldehyde dehydrogenase